MIAVWCTEGPIYKDKNGVYYSLTINDRIISRYLEYADKLYILTRVRKLEEKLQTMNMITSKNIEIIELPNCSSVKRHTKKYKTSTKKNIRVFEKSGLCNNKFTSNNREYCCNTM